MSIFRFISITIIALLLLSPLLKTISKRLEKPVVILAVDNSESVIINKDSVFYIEEFVAGLKQFVEELSDDYDVKTYTFGDKVGTDFNINFTEKQTDFTSLFKDIETTYSNRNVGALVLASDGIYNMGANPIYSSENIAFPVYTVALGDTSYQKDLIVKKVNYNKIAFLGNKFPLVINLNAYKCKDEKTTLTVSEGSKVIYTKTIDLINDDFSEQIVLKVEAKKKGMQQYTVKLSNLEEEISVDNNVKSIFIDVIDSKQKILILADVPHPDISALRQAIESNYYYEVEVEYLKDFTKSFSGYNLVILHQLPSVRMSQSSLKKLTDSKVPVLYILGSQTNLNLFNAMRVGVSVQVKGKAELDESLPAYNQKFSLFSLSDETKKAVQKFSPLLCRFGDYKTQNATDVLFTQKIGSLVTSKPLITFSRNFDSKYAVISGEGIWKWRLTDYLYNDNHEAFNEIVTKTVQYLSLKVEKSFFIVNCDNSFMENQSIEMEAEVYNQSYEAVTDVDVSINIINSDNKKFPFTFSHRGTAHYLNAGTFPPGRYKYIANVKVGEKVYREDGFFNVLDVNVESINTVANHQLLFNIADRHNGEMFYPKQLEELINAIRQREDITTVSYSQKSFRDLIDIKLVFFVILIFLTVEWFVRKRAGSY